MKRIFFLLLFATLPLLHASSLGKQFGQNDQSSREATAFVPAADTDNILQGFAVFEKGFIFENSSTTCAFDALFPVSSSSVLSGGTLTLRQDLSFKDPFALGSGTIDADGYVVKFLSDNPCMDLPSQHHTDLFSLIDNNDAGRDVYSASWSYDDNYLAIGTRVGGGVDELQVYYLDGNVLTLTASKDLGESAYSVQWHPSQHYLAVGHSTGGDELKVYCLNVAQGTFEMTDSANTGQLRAVAWNPTGNYLAVGRSWNTTFLVYEFAGGTLGTSYSGSFGSSRDVNNNAIDWDPTGSYISIGTDDDLRVFYFSGSALTQNAVETLGVDVNGVSWRPDDTIIAVALGGSSERIRLYEHDGTGGTLTEITSALVGDGQTSFGLSWNADGVLLGVAKNQSTAMHDFRIFSFESTRKRLYSMGGYSNASDMNCVAWRHSDNYVAVGDDGDYISLFGPVAYPLRFKDARIFFSSDVTFQGPVIFDGTCSIHGGEHSFDFADGGCICIAAGSSLLLEHAYLKGLTADKVACADDDGLLILHDVDWNQDSTYTFSVGSMHFDQNVVMSGDTTFVYACAKTSTILAKAQLEFDIGFTFSYDPGSTSKTLLELEDETSKLVLNGATLHATMTGMQLTKGQLRVIDDSTLSSEIGYSGSALLNEGITFGDGTAENDLLCDIYSGTMLNFSSGTLKYRNVSSSSWLMRNLSSKLYIQADARFYLYESINLGVGMLVLGNGSTLGCAIGKDVTGSIFPQGTVYRRNI